MERNSSNDERRTEARRQVTPTGEVIVEVPFTEAQARELLVGYEPFSEVGFGAYNLLRASLDYAVARNRRHDEVVDPDVAHKRRQGE